MCTGNLSGSKTDVQRTRGREVGLPGEPCFPPGIQPVSKTGWHQALTHGPAGLSHRRDGDHLPVSLCSTKAFQFPAQSHGGCQAPRAENTFFQ